MTTQVTVNHDWLSFSISKIHMALHYVQQGVSIVAEIQSLQKNRHYTRRFSLLPCIARAAVQKRRRHAHLSKLENKSLLFGTLGNTQRHLVDSIAPTNSFCMVITINYLYLFLVIGEHSPTPLSEYYQRKIKQKAKHLQSIT